MVSCRDDGYIELSWNLQQAAQAPEKAIFPHGSVPATRVTKGLEPRACDFECSMTLPFSSQQVGESPECLSKAAWQPDVLLHGTEAACGAPLRAEDSAGSEARLGEARDLAGVSGSAWGMPGSRPNSGDSGRAEPAGGPGGRGLLCARSQYSTVDVPEQGTAQVAQWWKGWQTLGPGKAGNRLVTSGNTEGDSKELRANVPVQGGGGSEMCCLDPSSLSGGGRGAGARLFPAR
ncbi:transmembrane gamma-carboxyglutamic acid protein 3 isoform X2 [Trachemys scripta elegans]|uniref:transmembrane gamma-carboxyglutamic acid protein 3 isoform X2 n=1 Tax=Trachemys scripta elegans TaxID=31138 RepID=UPI001556D885|nr:transmembrane gamma-carboxyglutamic acid protein 3 isoform X2 [Trachemys scripta elegans]